MAAPSAPAHRGVTPQQVEIETLREILASPEQGTQVWIVEVMASYVQVRSFAPNHQAVQDAASVLKGVDLEAAWRAAANVDDIAAKVQEWTEDCDGVTSEEVLDLLLSADCLLAAGEEVDPALSGFLLGDIEELISRRPRLFSALETEASAVLHHLTPAGNRRQMWEKVWVTGMVARELKNN